MSIAAQFLRCRGCSSLVTAVRFSNGQEALSIVYSGAKYACPALPILRDVITSISFRNGHKAPPKSLGHLRLRELRRQPFCNFLQKAPQPTALKPPSTARTAGRSDRAERRFRRQPFILLSFSSSKKARKAQETQPYQRIQCIGHTGFKGFSNAVTPPFPTSINGYHTSKGSWHNRLQNGPRLLSQAKVGTHSAFRERSHTRAHTPKQGLFRMGALLLPSERSARSQTSPGRVSERCTLPLLGFGRGCSRRTQRAFGTAMRLCASLFRRRRGPAGLRRPTPPAERTVLAPISPRVQLCLRRPAFPLSAFIPGA